MADASENTDTMSSCLALLASTCFALRRLVINIQCDPFRCSRFRDPPFGLGPEAISYEALKHLTSFHNLVDFTLESYNGIHVSDADIDDLARNWPSLENLCLSSPQQPSLDSRLTLSSLLSFATHCPELRTLHLFLLDANYIPALQYLPCRKLYNLSVRRFLFLDPFKVAIFLSGLLQPMCIIQQYDNNLDPSHRLHSDGYHSCSLLFANPTSL